MFACLFDDIVSEIEVGAIWSRQIARLAERRQARTRTRRHAELVLDQIDDDRAEAFVLAILQIAFNVFVVELSDQTTRRITHNQKWVALLVDEISAVLAYSET